MGSPDLIPSKNSIYGETEPLSPRYYDDPGPPPPTPPQKSNNPPPRREPRSPLEKHFAHTRLSPKRDPLAPVPIIQAPSSDLETLDESPYPDHRQLPPHKPHNKRAPPPLPLSIQTQAALGPTPTPAPHHLPLRSAPLPLRSTNNQYQNANRPPSTIKATVLERKPLHLNAQGGGLRPPLTGVPSTPYSPYMPFTPLTPLTPSRLVGRQERRRREREEGRRVVGLEDRVVEEGVMWGDGYC